MAGVCTEYFSVMPAIDVVTMCARDIVDQAAFQASGAATMFRGLDHFTVIVIATAVMVGPILVLRLVALLQAVGLIAWRARRPAPPRRQRMVLDAIAERRRGKPPAPADPAPV